MATAASQPDSSAAPAPIPTLHHLSSSQSQRVLWALEELSLAHGQPYILKTYQRIKARAPPELQKIFPLGKSPILEIEGVEDFRPQNMVVVADGQGEKKKRTVVTESRLILQYIADHYSRGIWVPDAEDRDRDTYFQEFANCTLAPTVSRTMSFDIVAAHAPLLLRLFIGGILRRIARMFEKDLTAPFALMEATLSSSEKEGKPWFSGSKLGLADFCLSWPMDMAEQRGYFRPEKYPRLAAWLERVHGREAYKNAREKGGSYDLVDFDF